MMMIELLLATALTCSESQDLILDVKKAQTEYKEDSINQYQTLEAYKVDLIETIKTNTEPGCYEGAELNS